ncbi:hypothetical protein RF11_00829 [Thelohanellus kitauei]|uniref:Uncharacterized protein n=1 Tax=Thelohanellus kitauei TaxID=669202 RepID=A0A0C2J4V4_THEKT|nr:hypothetical protein RF11_00829 [Thelohanellus kitauei]
MSGSEKFPFLVIGASKTPHPSGVKCELEAVDDGEAFRGDFACGGWTSRPEKMQRSTSQPPSRALAEQHPNCLPLNQTRLPIRNQGIKESDNLVRQYEKLLNRSRLEAIGEGEEFKFGFA